MAIADALRAGVAALDRVLVSGALKQTVTHNAWDGSTADSATGEPTLTATSVACVVEQRAKETIDERGNRLVGDTRLIFTTPITVRLADTFTIGGVTHKVVAINGVQDADGARYATEVELSR